MENNRQNREFINSLDKRLFWDVDIKDVDEERHKRFIIQRVLERGGLGDIRNTMKHYGLPVLTHEAQRIRSLDPVTLAFAVCLYQVPRETFQCCTWNP